MMKAFRRLGIRVGLVLVAAALNGGPIATQGEVSSHGLPSGGRVLSLSSTPRFDPPPTDTDYLAALNLAHEAGVNGAVMTWRWSELEAAAGEFNLDGVKFASEFYGNFRQYELFFGIQLINTTDKETPPDLLDVPFDSPQMLERFHALVDSLLPYMADVTYLSIGNEVDVYLGLHPDEWTTYKDFYDNAVDYVHQVAPHIKVGVTATFGGLGEGGQEANVAALNEASDVYILTYYPNDGGFDVSIPDVPLLDFPHMVDLAAGRPLVLQEVGYGTSPVLNSSEEQQAEFVRYVFEAWEASGESIPFLNFFHLHDFSEDLCDTFEEYYGLKNEKFHAFLCSLGLRHADGTPKLGWQAFMDASTAQGF